MAQLKELDQAEKTAAQGDPAWSVEVAVSLERFQRVLDAPDEEEIKWLEFKEQIDVEKAALLPVEIAYFKKKEEEEKLRSATGGRGRGVNTKLMGEENLFEAAPRRTADDEAGVMTSLNRQLDDRLYLIMKTNGDAKAGQWRMPETLHDAAEDSTLRATAERCLAGVLTPATEVHFVGNFPVLCETARFAAEVDGKIGTKTFFFRAALVSLDAGVLSPDHAWVTKGELSEYNAEYANEVARFMP